MNALDREAAVAGKFYPAHVTELNLMLDSVFKGCLSLSDNEPQAIIVPHAGYIFSANVAAKAISQISREAAFNRVFIIGSSHTMDFEWIFR